MTDLTRRELDEMSLSVLQRLNGLCNEFETACREGDLPSINAYLLQVDESRRPTLLRQLVPLHIDGRRKRV